MNRKALQQLITRSRSLDDHLEKHGTRMLETTHAWQSPLRSGGAAGPKGDHSDPTASGVLNPDPQALLHREYLRLLLAKDRADGDLAAFHHRHDPLTEAQVQRGRQSMVPGCVVCDGPAPPGHNRGGKCDACYKRWSRHGRPDTTTMRRQHALAVEAANQRIHEHEQEAS